MKKLLLDIHLYLGLICAAYMVIYGISTMAFNHGWRSDPVEHTWNATIVVPDGLEGEVLGAAIRDSLGLIGWIPPWRAVRKTEQGVRFSLNRPGRVYDVRLESESGEVQITESNRGLLSIIVSLHGLSRIPGSTWAPSWRVYTEISIWSMIFAAISGVYFWWVNVPERRMGRWLVVLGSGASLLFMLYMVS